MVLSSGKYDQAIVIPKNFLSSWNIAVGAIVLCCCISFTLCLLLFFIVIYFKIEFLTQKVYLFLPFSLILGTTIVVTQQLHISQRNFSLFAIVLFLESLAVSIVSLIMGIFIRDVYGLVIAFFIAQVLLSIIALSLLRKSYGLRNNLQFVSLEEIKRLFLRFISFPKFQMVSDVLMTSTQNLTPFLLAAFFSSKEVGFFALAIRIIRTPVNIAIVSFGNVFKKEALDEFREHGSYYLTFKKNLLKLFFISLFIAIVVVFFAPDVFAFVFGSEWRISGEFARALGLCLFAETVVNPLNALFQVSENQNKYLKVQVINTLLVTILICCGYYISKSIIYTLVFYSIATFLSSTYSLSVLWGLAKNKLNYDN